MECDDDGTSPSNTTPVTGKVLVLLGSQPFRRRKLFESSSPSTSISTKSHIDELPHELFVEILQRLPLKLIYLCKCVSKRWYNLISGPPFALRYAHNCSSLAPPFALFYQYKDRAIQLTSESPIFESHGFSLNFIPSSNPLSLDQHQPEPICFLASSNGLVLCSATSTFHKVYYVCNPLTMHWVELPPPATCQEKVSIGFVCKSSFSFDVTSLASSFRVVRIIKFEPENSKYWRSTNLKLEIFSSDTWKWTETNLSTQALNFTVSYCGPNAVVCNGILHWMYLYHRDKNFAYDPFNNTDQFRTIRQPKDIYPFASEHRCGEYQGHLRFIECFAHNLSIWELKDCNGLQWFLVHKVDLKSMELYDRWMASCLGNSLPILSLHPIDGNIIYLQIRDHIVLCNMRSRTLKKVCSAGGNHLWDSLVFPFVLPWWPTPVPELQQNALRTDGLNIQVSEPRTQCESLEDPVYPQQEAAAEEPTEDLFVDEQVALDGDIRTDQFQIVEENSNSCPLGSLEVVDEETSRGQEEGASTQAQGEVSRATLVLNSPTSTQKQSVTWNGIPLTRELAIILEEVTLLHPETFQRLNKKFFFFKQFVFESVGQILLILRQFRHKAVSASEIQFVRSTLGDLKEANIEIRWLEEQLHLAEMKMAKEQLAVRMQKIQKDIAEVMDVATRLEGEYATTKENFDAMKDVDVNQLGSG